MISYILSPKLQSEMLAICFLAQTGFCPAAVSHTLATGHGYSLRWEDKTVMDTNKERVKQFAIDGLKTKIKKKAKKDHARKND